MELTDSISITILVFVPVLHPGHERMDIFECRHVPKGYTDAAKGNL